MKTQTILMIVSGFFTLMCISLWTLAVADYTRPDLLPAKIIFESDQFDDIQKRFDAVAKEGGTVYLANGTYRIVETTYGKWAKYFKLASLLSMIIAMICVDLLEIKNILI